jgi:hypothetical protein
MRGAAIVFCRIGHGHERLGRMDALILISLAELTKKGYKPGFFPGRPQCATQKSPPKLVKN